MKYSFSSIQSSLHTQEPWINVIIFKYITIPLVYFIVNYTKITPNTISIISLILGMSSAYFYFTNEVFCGGLFYLISFWLLYYNYKTFFQNISLTKSSYSFHKTFDILDSRALRELCLCLRFDVF